MRSSAAVAIGILLVAILSLLAGWRTLVPADVAVWLPLVGLISGCLVIGVLSRLRAAHVVLVALAIYVAAILLVTLIDFAWSDITLGPVELGAVSASWTTLPATVFAMIPPLEVFSNLALMAASLSTETIVQQLLYNLVALSFFAAIGLVLAGLTAAVTRRRSVHVVTAPEVTGAEAAPSAPTEAGAGLPPPGVSTPPTRRATTAPRSAAYAPLPEPSAEALPASPAPSAKAIATLKGKAGAHLKSTGQEVPAGQARCPFCHATIIPGSNFCNACQKPIA